MYVQLSLLLLTIVAMSTTVVDIVEAADKNEFVQRWNECVTTEAKSKKSADEAFYYAKCLNAEVGKVVADIMASDKDFIEGTKKKLGNTFEFEDLDKEKCSDALGAVIHNTYVRGDFKIPKKEAGFLNRNCYKGDLDSEDEKKMIEIIVSGLQNKKEKVDTEVGKYYGKAIKQC